MLEYYDDRARRPTSSGARTASWRASPLAGSGSARSSRPEPRWPTSSPPPSSAGASGPRTRTTAATSSPGRSSSRSSATSITELAMRYDGDEGLFRAYESVEFLAPLYAGDWIEATGRIVRVGTTSRTCEFEVWKVGGAPRGRLGLGGRVPRRAGPHVPRGRHHRRAQGAPAFPPLTSNRCGTSPSGSPSARRDPPRGPRTRLRGEREVLGGRPRHRRRPGRRARDRRGHPRRSGPTTRSSARRARTAPARPACDG